MRRRERGGDDGVVDGEDEREADLDMVPRGTGLDGGGGVDEHPRYWNPECDRRGLPGKGEGEEEERVLEAEVRAEAGGGDGGGERGAREDVEAEEREVRQGLPRVPPLPPAAREVAGSRDGSGGGVHGGVASELDVWNWNPKPPACVDLYRSSANGRSTMCGGETKAPLTMLTPLDADGYR